MTRGRHHHPLEFSAPWRLALEPGNPPLDFAALFGNDRPVEVEIGHGKGAFLLDAALANPDRNFVGIEWASMRHVYVAERIAKRGLQNVRLVRGDAAEIFREQVPAGSLAAVHLYFPDPYWKKRHFKRRLVTPQFVAALARALAPGGVVLLKSDVPERFAAMTAVFAASEAFRPSDWHAATARYPDVASSFECKAAEAGREIGCVGYRRTSTSAPRDP